MVSEQQGAETEEVSSQQQNNTPSPGKILRERRESLGFTQQQIASKIYLKASQINDLEEDNLDSNASITFTKGYIRNYAKQLGLVPEEIVAQFEQYHNNLEPPSTKLQSFSRRVAKQTHDDRWMMVTYIILLLIVAGVVVWWYQQPNDENGVEIPLLDRIKGEATTLPVAGDTADENKVGSDGVGVTTSVEDDAPEENTLAVEQTDDASLTNDVVGSASEANDTSSNERVNSVVEASSEPSSSASSLDNNNEQSAVVDDTQTLSITESDVAPISMTFTFVDDCWVNIVDATDEAIAYGVKKAGRVMQIQGLPPVEVTLGAPENVRLSVNGEPVDISAYQNGRTARFSLPM